MVWWSEVVWWWGRSRRRWRIVRRVPGSVPVPPPAVTAVVPAPFLLATPPAAASVPPSAASCGTPVARRSHSVRHDPDDRDARQDGDGCCRDASPHTLPSPFVACPRLPGRWRIRLKLVTLREVSTGVVLPGGGRLGHNGWRRKRPTASGRFGLVHSSGATDRLRQGTTPSNSISNEKLRNVRTSTMTPRKMALSSVGSMVTVRTRSAAISTSSPSRIDRPMSCRRRLYAR